MIKKSLAALLSISLFATGPGAASAQTMGRAAIVAVNATPMTVISLHSGVQAAPVLNMTMPVLTPNVMIMSAAMTPAALAAGKLVPAAQAVAAAPVAASPLAAIQSDKVDDKVSALGALFDNASLNAAAPLELGPSPATIAKIDEYRFSEIPALMVQAKLREAVSLDPYLGVRLSDAQQSSLVIALMNGLNARWSTREVIAKFIDQFAQPAPKLFGAVAPVNTQWVKNAKAEFKRKYVGGFDGPLISLPAKSKVGKDDLAQLPDAVRDEVLKLLNHNLSPDVYKLKLSGEEIYAVYLNDGLVSEEVSLFDAVGHQFAYGTAEEVGGFHWQPLAVQKVRTVEPGNTGIAGGGIYQAVDEFRRNNLSRIIAIKGVTGVGIGNAKGPIGYPVLLVNLDGLVPEETVDAAIKALPGYNGKIHIRYEYDSFKPQASGGQNIMSQSALNSLFTRWKSNVAAQTETDKDDALSKPKLDDKAGHHSPFIKPSMYHNLVQAGLKPIMDVRELMKPGAEAALLKAGFKRLSDKEGTKIYVLRRGADINNSQRASFYKNGAASLFSISKPESQLFTETISIDAEGYIFNEVVSFDKSEFSNKDDHHSPQRR
jgi:hypothetical protein